MGKPILCLDFDGVCHSYSSGWQGADVISDRAVPGLFEFLEQAAKHFDIQVFSSRSHQPGGVEAMMAWFIAERRRWRLEGGMHETDAPLPIGFPEHKPSAFLSIDDRGFRFEGVWPDPERLLQLRPWNKGE